MKTLQWLFKSCINQEPPPSTAAPALPAPPLSPAIYNISSKKEQCEKEDEEAEADKARYLVIYNWISDHKPENMAFTILLTTDNGHKYFYRTLHLKQLRRISERKSRSFWGANVGRKGHDEALAINYKVLPLCDGADDSLFAGGGGGGMGSEKEKKKRVSRVKELVKWAATSKSNRGRRKDWKKVMYFENRVMFDSPKDSTSTSSNISFMWDLGSYRPSSSSVNFPLSMASASRKEIWKKNIPNKAESSKSSDLSASIAKKNPVAELSSRTGQWITTDSDFVVLEL